MLKIYRIIVLKIKKYLFNNIFKKEKKIVFQNNTINNIIRFYAYKFFLNFILFYKKGDFWKHWDFFKELSLINEFVSKNQKILICSIGKDFTNIFFLNSIGYKKLYCFDIRDIHESLKKKVKKKNINFQIQNLYNLKYKKKFDFISLTSVIEHLDKIDLLFKNLNKVSNKGTRLFITTDFWPEEINTKGLFPYGKNLPEMKVFNIKTINELLDVAKNNNFILEDNKINFEVKKKYVLWKRMNIRYTFISLTFIKNV